MLAGLCVALGTAGAALLGSWSTPPPVEREITVVARQFAYEPERIHANQGDIIHFRLLSKDVIHGFYLEGHDLDAEIHPQQKKFTVRHPDSGKPEEQVERITVEVKRRGKFRFRCSHTCGSMHPFMTGELIVAPNTPLHAGVGGVIGLFIGMLLAARKRGKTTNDNTEENP
jgi:heme/copper-type cytochrome/quinol oxidase subunit 2